MTTPEPVELRDALPTEWVDLPVGLDGAVAKLPVCPDCCALVPEPYYPEHVAYHARVGAVAELACAGMSRGEQEDWVAMMVEMSEVVTAHVRAAMQGWPDR